MKSVAGHRWARVLAGLWLSALVAAGCGEAPADVREKPEIPGGVALSLAAGEVVGEEVSGVRRWLGIPYAATPVGALRFRPPATHQGWDGALIADDPGPACAQMTLPGAHWDEESSEDCLRLHVFSPSPAPKAPLPVMVWIHGGAFVTGQGALPLYDGTHLARRGVVIVAINYRLGIAGFWQLDESAAEDGRRTGRSANLGLQDQLAALRWVQENIAAFGGDKDNVTIFGESAGGLSVCALLTMTSAEGLFAKAIIQSGLCHTRLPSMAKIHAQSLAVANAAGCTTKGSRLSCMRGLPIKKIATALEPAPLPGGLLFGTLEQLSWRPYVDGHVLTAQPWQLLDASQAHLAPVLLGTTRDEAALFHAGVTGEVAVTSDAAYLKALGRRFGSRAHDVVDRYPAKELGGFDKALAKVGTDAFFTCPARRTAKAVAAYTQAWRYQFTHQPTGTPLASLGAFHAAELPYVFGNSGGLVGGTVVGDGLKVSALMQQAWTRFARTGDPNDSGGEPAEITADAVTGPKWPAWSKSDPYVELTWPAAVGAGLDTKVCDFWDHVPFHEEQ